MATTFVTSPSSRNKSLASLSVDDVVHVFESLNIPNCEEAIQSNKIDGNTLLFIEELTDFSELGLKFPIPKQRLIFNQLKEFKKDGVSLDMLGGIDSSSAQIVPSYTSSPTNNKPNGENENIGKFISQNSRNMLD